MNIKIAVLERPRTKLSSDQGPKESGKQNKICIYQFLGTKEISMSYSCNLIYFLLVSDILDMPCIEEH